MGSWLSVEDFEEMDYRINSYNNIETSEKNKIESYYRKMEHKSHRELYQVANSLYFGRYHPKNTEKIVDTRGAAI